MAMHSGPEWGEEEHAGPVGATVTPPAREAAMAMPFDREAEMGMRRAAGVDPDLRCEPVLARATRFTREPEMEALYGVGTAKATRGEKEMGRGMHIALVLGQATRNEPGTVTETRYGRGKQEDTRFAGGTAKAPRFSEPFRNRKRAAVMCSTCRGQEAPERL